MKTETLKNIRSIYQLLESQDIPSIEIALGMLQNNNGYLQLARKRYLKFVQARLNDPKADMNRFAEAMLSKDEEENILIDIALDDDSISFDFRRPLEAKAIVDTIGGIVASHFDVIKYKKRAIKLNTKSKLIKLANQEGTKLKREMKKSLEIYKEGWLGKIQEKLMKLDSRIVSLDHATFEEVNSSFVLEEFLFYLDTFSSSSVVFDIFQSYPPKFPELFWMMQGTPEIHGEDGCFSLPDSPMSFDQMAIFRKGDHGTGAVVIEHSHKK